MTHIITDSDWFSLQEEYALDTLIDTDSKQTILTAVVPLPPQQA